MSLILASTSVYRRELLTRLQLPFAVFSPGVDETPLTNEPAPETARRLAEAKAAAGRHAHPGALIVGSDQVAELDGMRLDKPGSHARAAAQLRVLSGRAAVFHTAVALLNAASGSLRCRVVPTRVQFRNLTAREIDSYLAKEQPYDCAGSAKSEGLGIALLRSIEGDDPTALIGLPLIALTEMLMAEGIAVV